MVFQVSFWKTFYKCIPFCWDFALSTVEACSKVHQCNDSLLFVVHLLSSTVASARGLASYFGGSLHNVISEYFRFTFIIIHSHGFVGMVPLQSFVFALGLQAIPSPKVPRVAQLMLSLRAVVSRASIVQLLIICIVTGPCFWSKLS